MSKQVATGSVKVVGGIKNGTLAGVARLDDRWASEVIGTITVTPLLKGDANLKTGTHLIAAKPMRNSTINAVASLVPGTAFDGHVGVSAPEMQRTA